MEIPLNLDPSIIISGLLYLLMFRLAVIVLGGLSIYLGYRLFIQAMTGCRRKGEKAENGAAEPGLFFAAFWDLIVIAALAGSLPPKYKRF